MTRGRSPRWRRNRRLKCGCLGYWFPHRITSGSCYHRADQVKAREVAMRREGIDVEAVRLGCPF